LTGTELKCNIVEIEEEVKKMTETSSQNKFLKAMAYWAVVLIGIALLFADLFKGGGQVGYALRTIANVLAYVVVGCYSFFYARNKNIWWIIAWAVAIVLIILFTILPLITG
jgi:hypothetical protein